MSLDIHSVPSVAAGQMDPTVEPEGVEFVLRHMTGAECLSEGTNCCILSPGDMPSEKTAHGKECSAAWPGASPQCVCCLLEILYAESVVIG